MHRDKPGDNPNSLISVLENVIVTKIKCLILDMSLNADGDGVIEKGRQDSPTAGLHSPAKGARPRFMAVCNL